MSVYAQTSTPVSTPRPTITPSSTFTLSPTSTPDMTVHPPDPDWETPPPDEPVDDLDGICSTNNCYVFPNLLFITPEISLTLDTFELWDVIEPNQYVLEIFNGNTGMVLVSEPLGDNPIDLEALNTVDADVILGWTVRAINSEENVLYGRTMVSLPPVWEVSEQTENLAQLNVYQAQNLYYQWDFSASAQAMADGVNWAINNGSVEDVYYSTAYAGTSLPFVTLIDGLEMPAQLTLLNEFNQLAANSLELEPILEQYFGIDNENPFTQSINEGSQIRRFELELQPLFSLTPVAPNLVMPSDNFSEVFLPLNIEDMELGGVENK